MFTGLIEARGTVCGIEPTGPGKRLTISAAGFFAAMAIGESVAISGCCLTIVACDADRASFDAGQESLGRTTLGRLAVGGHVNLERATAAGRPLGGHIVTGHVDGVGTVVRRIDSGEWSDVWIRVPAELARQMASKGSVAVNGVSLTLVDVRAEQFSVALIPHTLATTTLERVNVGDDVNIETDILAKYVQRQLAAAGLIHPDQRKEDRP